MEDEAAALVAAETRKILPLDYISLYVAPGGGWRMRRLL
jgi:hypothetical protein